MEPSVIRKRFFILLDNRDYHDCFADFPVRRSGTDYCLSDQIFQIVNHDEIGSTQMSELAGELLRNLFIF